MILEQLIINKDSLSGLLTSLQSRAELGYHDVAVLFAMPSENLIYEIKKIDIQLTEVKNNPYIDTNGIVTAAKNNLNEAEKNLVVVGLASLTATEEQIAQGAVTYGCYLCKNIHKKDGTIDAYPRFHAYKFNPTTKQLETVPIQLS
jgi:hypothetical protein